MTSIYRFATRAEFIPMCEKLAPGNAAGIDLRLDVDPSNELAIYKRMYW